MILEELHKKTNKNTPITIYNQTVILYRGLNKWIFKRLENIYKIKSIDYIQIETKNQRTGLGVYIK